MMGRFFLVWMSLLLLPAAVWGQSSVDPREFGLDLPPGMLSQPASPTVTTNDPDGKPVVGRIQVAVGDSAVVLLPDGQLVARKAGEFTPTDKKFVPADKEELAIQLVAKEFAGFKVKQTKHYIYIYNSSEEFYLGTSRILETMLPGVTAYVEGQKIDTHPPEVPLIVVMFATDEQFQAYRRMPPGVIAYYHTLSNRVFMYEQSALARERPDLALQQAISTVAHEGAHQILHNIGVQQRLSIWPMWISEGLAEYFAPTSIGKGLRWKGAGQVNDLRMFELEQYVKSRASVKPDGQLVEHTVAAARLSSTGYASAWALTHYLAKNKRPEFNAYMRAVSKLGPMEGSSNIVPPGIVKENLELFRQTFGDKFDDLETRLVAHLKKQDYTDPFADQPHFVAAIAIAVGKRPQRQVQTFHNPKLAEKWIRETVEKLPAEQRDAAESVIRQFPNRAAAETFASQWTAGK